VRIDDLTLQDTMTAAPNSTCYGFQNSILSRRVVGIMRIAVGDLRVYSLSDASMFDLQFTHRTTFTADQLFIPVFSH